MYKHLIVAIIAAMINIMLSVILPFILQDSTLPFAAQIRKNYSCNREVIMVSSVLVILFVYISLGITPWIETNVFSQISKLGTYTKLK